MLLRAATLLPLLLAAAPQDPPFDVAQGEKIGFVGGSLGERMNLFGHFEALLHTRFPDRDLVVRNFCRPADEVGLRQRPSDYAKIDDPLAVFSPRTLLCFFGYCESFAGPVGLAAFQTAYEAYLDEMARKYKVERFVLVSPAAYEPPNSSFLPDGKSHNANLKAYSDAVAAVAGGRKLHFIDVFTPTEAAFPLLRTAATDAHPRVRTEAVRALSEYPNLETAEAVVEAAKLIDPWLHYTADAALGANVAVWREAHSKGSLAKGDPGSKMLLDAVLSADKRGAQAVPHLQVLLSRDPRSAEERSKAVQALADLKGGNADQGKAVFRRTCTACHKVFGEGAEFGPDMMKVATRLPRPKLVESIIDPNADVDPKYLSTLVRLKNGDVVSGLPVSETLEALVIFNGKEKRTIPPGPIEQRKALKQSSMPEGLAAGMSPTEFLDLVEFLGTLK
jgi:putative heme-binding domain-containing protein